MVAAHAVQDAAAALESPVAIAQATVGAFACALLFVLLLLVLATRPPAGAADAFPQPLRRGGEGGEVRCRPPPPCRGCPLWSALPARTPLGFPSPARERTPCLACVSSSVASLPLLRDQARRRTPPTMPPAAAGRVARWACCVVLAIAACCFWFPTSGPPGPPAEHERRSAARAGAPSFAFVLRELPDACRALAPPAAPCAANRNPPSDGAAACLCRRRHAG